jgi:hypothetical protein
MMTLYQQISEIYENDLMVRSRCDTVGHVGSELIEYVDGVFVTFCDACSEKIVIEKIPGDFPRLKMVSLLVDLMQGGEFDLSLLKEIDNALRIERAQLEAAELQLSLAKDMIRSNYVNRIETTK